MTKEQESIISKQIHDEMMRVRNDAMVTGMKSAISVVFDICNKEITDTEKLEEIRTFCEKGLYNGERKQTS